jgi:hypothetical protein
MIHLRRICTAIACAFSILMICLLAGGTLRWGDSSGAPQGWVAHAEGDALRHLHRMTCAPGQAAEAWAEVNSLMPQGYEVIAECTSPAPRT